MLNAQQTNFTPRELPPVGNQVGRLYSIIHIGSSQYDFKGETITTNKVRFTFELPDELREFKEGEGMKPMVISQELNLSMGEKSKLRPFVEGLIGTALTKEESNNFDVETLIDTTCLLNIVHVTKNDKTFANIASVSPLPKSMLKPVGINEAMILNYGDRWDVSVFNSLPEFLRKKMEETPEYKKATDGPSDGSGMPTF